MARIARIIIPDKPVAYHIISRTALDGYPLQDVEKDYFVELVRHLSRIYFVEILGFCCMGNHFHLLVKTFPEKSFTDKEVKRRYELCFGKDRKLSPGQIPFYSQKWTNLSAFMKDVKQKFSLFYNKRHNRRGFFWGDRFKSVIVEDGNTLINCLAYIDLNPVRAGIVEKPEDYRWNSIGYHIQTNNKGQFLSLDFGLKEFGVLNDQKRLKNYRRFLYEAGAIDKGKGKITTEIVEKERKKDFNVSSSKRLMYRTRYFSDSGIIGTKNFVADHYQRYKDIFNSKKDKVPKRVNGLNDIYSLKRLME